MCTQENLRRVACLALAATPGRLSNGKGALVLDMDDTKVMVTLRDGMAIALDDYERIFSSAAADSPKIEDMELSLYRTRMETERLTRGMPNVVAQATSHATRDHADGNAQGFADVDAVTVTQSPDGVVLVNVPTDASATSRHADDAHDSHHDAEDERFHKRQTYDATADGDIDIDVDIPVPPMTSHGRKVRVPTHETTTCEDDVRPLDRSQFAFSADNAEIPAEGTFTYMPPESYEDAAQCSCVTLPVIGKSSGFVSEVSVLESKRAGRRSKRHRP